MIAPLLPTFSKKDTLFRSRFFEHTRVQNKTELAAIHPLRHPFLNDPIFP